MTAGAQQTRQLSFSRTECVFPAKMESVVPWTRLITAILDRLYLESIQPTPTDQSECPFLARSRKSTNVIAVQKAVVHQVRPTTAGSTDD